MAPSPFVSAATGHLAHVLLCVDDGTLDSVDEPERRKGDTLTHRAAGAGHAERRRIARGERDGASGAEYEHRRGGRGVQGSHASCGAAACVYINDQVEQHVRMRVLCSHGRAWWPRAASGRTARQGRRLLRAAGVAQWPCAA